MKHHHGPDFMPRREFLMQTGGGIAGLALTTLLSAEGLLAPAHASTRPGGKDQLKTVNPLAPKPPHFPAKARRVISIFLYGGLSQIDSFDPKAELDKQDGQSVAGRPGFDTMGRSAPGKLMKSPFSFKKYGQCGQPVSDLFPHIGECVDDIAFLHSMKSESNNHVPAVCFMLTGSVIPGRAGLGSWVTYGLGSENENLPAFVVMTDPRNLVGGGAANWNSGFLPTNYQGVQFRSQGLPVLNLKPADNASPEQQRKMLDLLGKLNEEFLRERPQEQELAARIRAYELAFKMQTEATEAVDLNKESAETKALYGMDNPVTEVFGRQCLMARRLVERGVRFVQLYSGGGIFDQSWDAHGDIVKNHKTHALEIDKPISGLLKDLKRTGLLDDTLVVFHTEFGRMPFTEGSTGRDHNPHAFTVWLAGGGVKGGMRYGESDEIGYKVGTEELLIHDLNATILHLLGLDHTKLTFHFAGRDYRLTDVFGNVVKPILA